MEPVINCQAVAKTFCEGALKVAVLKDINLRVARAQQIAIVGTSGAGKSTLLHILGGLAEPTHGKVLIDGKDINRLTQTARGNLRNTALGFVYQFHHLLAEFTAIENVAMPLWIARKPSDEALDEAQTILSRVGLQHRLTHKPSELSGGERQRAAIARAMVTKPKCIMADEPTGNLDAATAQSIHELMLELNQEMGTSLIVATHDRRLAQKMGEIYRIENGSLQRSD